jgi:type 1 fimbria pilin
MSVTLTDASGNDVGNTSNTLALSSTSTAAGIGVQIQYNGIVRSYGPDSNVAGNTNQFLLTTGANGVYNFPFYANMIRTGTVKAGSVITTATFTMSYQ